MDNKILQHSHSFIRKTLWQLDNRIKDVKEKMDLLKVLLNFLDRLFSYITNILCIIFCLKIKIIAQKHLQFSSFLKPECFHRNSARLTTLERAGNTCLLNASHCGLFHRINFLKVSSAASRVASSF